MKINFPYEHPLLNLILKSEDLQNKKSHNIQISRNISNNLGTLNSPKKEPLKTPNKLKNNLNFTIEKRMKSKDILENSSNKNNRDFKTQIIIEKNETSENKAPIGVILCTPNKPNDEYSGKFTIINGNVSGNSNVCCDDIFYEYLKSISKFANQKYFIFIFKFILIFRECINTYKNIELENSILVLKENIPHEIKEFTQYYDAEQAPELCNEFISEYLDSNDYFGFEKKEIPEIIDVIQHFCYWMYENNYTSSRLSILNMH